MVRLLALLAVVVSALVLNVAGFPTGPGTCVVTGMSGNPHGSKVTAGGKYSILISAPTPGATANNYNITINGNGSFTGLLLYAADAANNNTRFGSFLKPPAGFGLHPGCSGVNPASNTLGHVNPSVKKFPLHFTWSPAGYNASKPFVANFTGIIMTSNAKVWYVLPPQSISATPVPSNASSGSPSPSSTSLPNTTIIVNGTTTKTSSSHSVHISSSLAFAALFSVAVLLV